MNKWLKELKQLTKNEKVINYYETMINEEELDNYDDIVKEFGTPLSVFKQEKDNFDIEENKISTIKKGTVTLFKKIVLSISIFLLSLILFTFIVLPLAAVFSIFAQFFITDITMYEKIIQILFSITIIPTSIAIVITIFNLIKVCSTLFKGKKFNVNKKRLKILLPTIIIGTIICVILGFVTFNVQNKSLKNLYTYTQSFTDKVVINANDKDFRIEQGTENKIEYEALKPVKFDNNVLNLNQEFKVGLIAQLTLRKAQVKISVKNIKSLVIKGSNLNVNSSSINLNDLELLVQNTNITLNNAKMKNLNVVGSHNEINFNKIIGSKVKLDNFDQTVINNSKIDELRLQNSEEIVNINNSNILKLSTKNVQLDDIKINNSTITNK